MARRKRLGRRTQGQADADRRAADLAARLGRMLRDGRRARHLTQREAAEIAGIAQQTWSHLEIRGDARMTISTWGRAAAAVGASLDAYLKQTSAASAPRDAVHLRNQELVISVALRGGWQSAPEAPIDRDARTSRFGDVVLRRGSTYALVEIWDWFDDVGAAFRDFDRRLGALDRYSVAKMRSDVRPVVGGSWVVRATHRNRLLLAEHRNTFRARFPGSGNAWLATLTRADAAMPSAPAVLWVSVGGDRLFPARLG